MRLPLLSSSLKFLVSSNMLLLGSALITRIWEDKSWSDLITRMWESSFWSRFLMLFITLTSKTDYETVNQGLKKQETAYGTLTWAETTLESKLAKRILVFLLQLLNVKKIFFNLNINKIWFPNCFSHRH